MVRIVLLLASASLLLSPAFCAPFSLNTPVIARNVLAKRAHPDTGDDFPDTEPHPNDLDKVEAGFNDAIELASYALTNLARNDNTILKHYFREGDKDKVKNVFQTIIGAKNTPEQPGTGNDKLGDIFVQTEDPKKRCKDGRTLAFMEDHNTDKPFIVLCPNAFKKKGVTAINGAENPADDPKDLKFYIDCDDLYINGHVSYLMNSLGATLLHEYLVGSIIDQPNGYGPVNVYNKLDKAKALTNADSYMYYALVSAVPISPTLWLTQHTLRCF
ncbi:MAG: hypothetical protein Q9187_005488 [Circinaria calcarea]